MIDINALVDDFVAKRCELDALAKQYVNKSKALRATSSLLIGALLQSETREVKVGDKVVGIREVSSIRITDPKAFLTYMVENYDIESDLWDDLISLITEAFTLADIKRLGAPGVEKDCDEWEVVVTTPLIN